MNFSSHNKLGTGTGMMNMTSLLKSNILEEDGIEDLHFYFVAFNQHKKLLLKKKEEKEKNA
jgi:hypothetical protein